MVLYPDFGREKIKIAS